MTHPFERWPATHRRRALIAVIVAALALEIVLAVLDASLRDTDEGGTIALELAGSPEDAAEIVDAWRDEGVLADGAFITGLDFLFALLYAAAIAGSCVAASGMWRGRGHPRLAAAGIVIAWVATLAAAFDWAENVALTVILLDEPISPWPQIALAAAIPKFAGATAGLVYAIAGGITALGGRSRPPSAPAGPSG